MIFFSLKKLEKALVERKVSDKDAFNYFLILSIFSGISMYFLSDDANSELKFFDILLTILLTFFGFKQCFKVNSAGDNEEFYKRLFSLSLVIFIKISFYCLLLLTPYVLVLIWLELEIDSKENIFIEIFDFLFDKVVQLIYYIMMYKSLHRISRHTITNG